MDGFVEVFVDAVLAVVSHLDVVGSELFGIGGFEEFLSALDAEVAGEEDGFLVVGDAKDDAGVVDGIGGDLGVFDAQDFDLDAVEGDALADGEFLDPVSSGFDGAVECPNSFDVRGGLGFMFGDPRFVWHGGVDVVQSQLPGVFQNSGEGVDVVGVGVGDEPGVDVVSEGGEEAAEVFGVALHAAVDDDDFSAAGAEDIGHILRRGSGGELPEGEGLTVCVGSFLGRGPCGRDRAAVHAQCQPVQGHPISRNSL